MKIILAKRDSAEVIASQRKMLEREHKGGGRTDDHALGRTFAAQLFGVRFGSFQELLTQGAGAMAKSFPTGSTG